MRSTSSHALTLLTTISPQLPRSLLAPKRERRDRRRRHMLRRGRAEPADRVPDAPPLSDDALMRLVYSSVAGTIVLMLLHVLIKHGVLLQPLATDASALTKELRKALPVAAALITAFTTYYVHRYLKPPPPTAQEMKSEKKD